jgi:hypothetical protein
MQMDTAPAGSGLGAWLTEFSAASWSFQRNQLFWHGEVFG